MPSSCTLDKLLMSRRKTAFSQYSHSSHNLLNHEYKEPGFLAVERLGSFPPPPLPLPTASCISYLNLPKCCPLSLLKGEGGGEGGGGAKSYDSEKAWNNRQRKISFAPPILSCCSYSTTSFVLSLSEGFFIFFFLHRYGWNIQELDVIHRYGSISQNLFSLFELMFREK